MLQVFHTTLTSMATASSGNNNSLGKLLLHALLTWPQAKASESIQESSALALSALQSTLASITCTDIISTDLAICVLMDCSESSSAFFLRQQDLFVRVMARMENLQDAQIHSLAKLFGKMLVQENAPADEMLDTEAFPFTCAARQHYDNLLAAANNSKKSVAVVGILQWVFELAAASQQRAEAARSKLEMLIERIQKIPVLMAFLLDTFSNLLVSRIQANQPLTSV